MELEQILLIIAAVWALALSYFCFALYRRLRKLEKQPPKHTHLGEDVLFKMAKPE